MLIEKARQLAYFTLLGSLVSLSFSNSFFEIFSGVYMGLCLVLVLTQKRRDIFSGQVAFFAVLYFLIVVLSFFVSDHWENSIKGVFRVFRCVLMAFFCLYVVDTEKKFKTAYYVLAWTALLVGIDAWIQAGTGFDWIRGRPMTPYTQDVGRVTGPFNHANDFSAFLTVTLFLFLGMIPHAFWEKNWREKFFFLCGSAVLGLSLLWTYARGAWLAVGVVFVAMAFIKRNHILTISLVGACVLVFLFSPSAVRRMTSLWGDPHGGTVTERRYLWDESVRMVRARPLLGFGVNTYSKVAPEFKSKEFPSDNQYAHNGYLQIAAETGLLGLGAFLAFLLSFFVSAKRYLFKARAGFMAQAAFSVCFGLAAFLMHSAIETNLQSLRLVSLLWLGIGLVLAAERISQKPA